MTPKLPFWLLILLALDLAKHALIFSLGSAQPWPDSASYWNYASDVAHGDLLMTSSSQCHRTPLYPYYLSLFQITLGPCALLGVIISQHLLSIATSLLVVTSVWLLTQSRRASILAYALLILSTSRILFANFILTETLFIFLQTLLITWLTYCWTRRETLSHLRFPIITGLLLGLLLLQRPSAVAVIPSIVIAMAVGLKHNLGFRWFQRTVIAFTTTLLLIAPWLIRNQFLFERPTLSIFLGRELWTTTFSPWPGAALDLPPNKPDTLDAFQELLPPLETWNWRNNNLMFEFLLTLPSPPNASDEAMKLVAQDAIRQHPRRWLQCAAARTATFWYCWDWPIPLDQDAPQTPPDTWLAQHRLPMTSFGRIVNTILAYAPEKHRIPSLILNALTFASAFYLLIDRRFGRLPLIFIGILITTTLLTALLEIPCYRYRMPLEPLAIVIVTLALFSLTKTHPPTNRP